MRNIEDSVGMINSVYPCTEYLTFGPWIYMVPQYKPEDVLMLGYGGGTTAGLIRLFYGSVPIVALDISIENTIDYYNVDLKFGDAKDWVKTNQRPFDCVIVDLTEDGNPIPPDFVSTKEFANELKRFARYIIVHASENTDMSAYGTPLKILQLNNSRFYYYVVYEIPNLPIR